MTDELIEIESVVKNKKNYIVQTKNAEYKMDEDTIIKYNIFKDAQFSKKEFAKILDEVNVNNYFVKALNYLSYGPRTIKEIENYLEKHQVNNKDQKKIIKKLSDFGYLNDIQYAKNVIEYESKVKRRGPKYITQKLQTKGVPLDIINKFIIDYNENLQIQNIEYLANKEQKLKNKLPVKKQKQVITEKLLRQGFDNYLVYEYVNSLEIEDDSYDMLCKEFEKVVNRYEKKDLTPAEKKNKIITYLLNKGYEYTNILEMFAKLEY